MVILLSTDKSIYTFVNRRSPQAVYLLSELTKTLSSCEVNKWMLVAILTLYDRYRIFYRIQDSTSIVSSVKKYRKDLFALFYFFACILKFSIIAPC